jgi:hypothetical protein
MKKAFRLLLLLVVVGCGASSDENTAIKPDEHIGQFKGSFKRNQNYNDILYLDTITIDGCEYLYTETISNRFVFTHKGNCKNHFKKGRQHNDLPRN